MVVSNGTAKLIAAPLKPAFWSNACQTTGDNGDCPAVDYSKDFTRVGVDWERDHISWYLNGKKCATFSDAAQIENGPTQIIPHMIVDNDWQRKWDVGLTDPTLTRQLEVDYLRVFQQVPA